MHLNIVPSSSLWCTYNCRAEVSVVLAPLSLGINRLRQVHYLSGPVAVTDGSGAPAHPGDILVVRTAGLGLRSTFRWLSMCP